MGQNGEDAGANVEDRQTAASTVTSEPAAPPPGRPFARARTAPPPVAPLPEEEDEAEIALQERMAEKLERLQGIQDYLHNPIPFDLKVQPLEASSTPEEIAERRRELNYQAHVLESIIEVIHDELDMLDKYDKA
ncbi:hypothetical protein [Acuticoccus sp. I52.16.1]|uniref:hypothetical protein n=1 Tax=Acuticoccus sp. I52.16.1 TaxID=2928472 RepID=UPI001FD50673|nr:hypothetical protein [Acuticoccus sp. I52.16.1]UOM32856.1 hypothetical protein MRB58_13325 [Acuticoccus sp. I52.16.1]